MEIREATGEDINEIVRLLKKSLGESLMPKSEGYWKWKHVENPFGPSPVLICSEGNEIIGVRAFMRWEWIHQGKVYRAVRAVDTATHPDHQGKGIFKKLTLALVDRCTREGDHLVFNTPNGQSKPGYIKMGWMEAGTLPVRITVQKPLNMAYNWVRNGAQKSENLEQGDLHQYLQHPGLASLLVIHGQQQVRITTRVTPEYLSWRYMNVPVAKYVAVGEEKDGELTGLIIGRIKGTRMGKELRITDCFFRNNDESPALLQNLRARKAAWGIDYTTLSGTGSAYDKKITGGLGLHASIGPSVTVKRLAATDLSEFINFNQWSPSLGDLELF